MRQALSLTLFALAVGPFSVARSAEPWSDSKLPVTDGLELWLDAARPADKPRPPGPLDVWMDGSGKGRHVRQPSEAARPRLLKHGNSQVVRFDGEDDNLRAVGQVGELKAFSAFVVLVPRYNTGGFQGFFALNKANERDYTSGLTIDMGPQGTARFTQLNVEGRGFGGWADLMKSGGGMFHQLYTLEVQGDEKAVRLTVDGKPAGERPRKPEPLSLEEITVGARFVNNGPGPQKVHGNSRSDFAEVIVYNRALDAGESKKVRDYLRAKNAQLQSNPLPDGEGTVLVPVANPPPVQVFLPGFTVRQLPVDLPNINNVLYRPDGTLVALGYNGDVWLLRDTDGDGLEDKAELFWESKGRLRGPVGMDLTPPGYKHGDGVFVASKGKVSLIVDTDRDGKADKEVIVAQGWKELPVNVDAVGVAFDKRDGSIYFGRGTANFTNPYLIDKDGTAHYSITDDAAVIMRIAPDFQTREVIATGIRFPVSLRINKAGDLFCTDQEGATWLANGNPFDELLHVQKGRHYGFPPRHPKHLPNVIDEPSVFDFAPQHQSTCGLNFNYPVKDGGPAFGPKAWAGDAIVSGYSRGKLFRTKLVPTPAGYVARTQLLACLNMLTVDARVTPDGGLVVSCHSGGPDWGTGPTGKGKLYKITYTDRDHPQPVFAWPAGPREVRVEFDRPVDPELLHDAVRQTKITAGQFARAGDRFESLWPGYAVVQAQKRAPRHDVSVLSAQLTPDRRTLVLATDPLPAAVHYALTLPGMGRPKTAKGLEQHSQIDLDFDLSGCAASWKPADGSPGWTGWLPHLDLDISRKFTAGSAHHDALWTAMNKPGELTLTAQLNLTDMLRPAVQPGSKIDYQLPVEKVDLALMADVGMTVAFQGKNTGQPAPTGRPEKLTIACHPAADRWEPIEVRLLTAGKPPSLSVTWTTAEDDRARSLPLRRALVPWADATPNALTKPPEMVKVPELEGGSWARGRAVFFDAQIGCAKCHTIYAQGGAIGPDLSNLAQRDYASVLRDISKPSFAINPDHLTYTVSLHDGRTLTGVVRTEGGKLHVGDQKGAVTVIDKADVDQMKPSPLSTMPDDLLKPLGADRTRDLLTFLLTAPPSMPRDYAGTERRPKPRTVAEVNAVLAGAPEPPAKTRPIRVVLVAGPKDHGPGEHDYPAWQKAWKELLSAGDKIEVVTAWEWPPKEEFRKADVMVFYQHGKWDAKRAADIDAFLERGGGLVYVHWAVDGGKDADGFARRIGLASGPPGIKFRHGPLDLTFQKHPIARNIDKLHLVDESYWLLRGKLPKDRVIATGVEEKEPRPLFWTTEPGKGRVFVSIPGHFSWTFDDPLFRVILLRGIAWTAKEPVDRFNDLVWPGADVAK
ncbi:MAG TPA: ThuA domain-containing protein [Fimbriiglobus sp.]|nr:ThuA domain-containing protein [Fimbriiglobus sp.]